MNLADQFGHCFAPAGNLTSLDLDGLTKKQQLKLLRNEDARQEQVREMQHAEAEERRNLAKQGAVLYRGVCGTYAASVTSGIQLPKQCHGCFGADEERRCYHNAH